MTFSSSKSTYPLNSRRKKQRSRSEAPKSKSHVIAKQNVKERGKKQGPKRTDGTDTEDGFHGGRIFKFINGFHHSSPFSLVSVLAPKGITYHSMYMVNNG
jgi:hypothetical protein